MTDITFTHHYPVMEMKNALSLAVTVLILAGCSKEERLGAVVETAPTTQKSNGCGSTKSACDGLLVFANQAHYDATYACLEERLNNYLDGFEAENSGLNDEEFNDLADNVGFGDEQPLIDFETTHGINSYRRKMQELEDLWLLGGANPASNPEQYNMIDDEVDETLFNEHGLVVIGSFVIYIDPSGQEWRIPFTTCAALDEMLATGIPSEYKVLEFNEQMQSVHRQGREGVAHHLPGARPRQVMTGENLHTCLLVPYRHQWLILPWKNALPYNA